VWREWPRAPRDRICAICSGMFSRVRDLAAFRPLPPPPLPLPRRPPPPPVRGRLSRTSGREWRAEPSTGSLSSVSTIFNMGWRALASIGGCSTPGPSSLRASARRILPSFLAGSGAREDLTQELWSTESGSAIAARIAACTSLLSDAYRAQPRSRVSSAPPRCWTISVENHSRRAHLCKLRHELSPCGGGGHRRPAEEGIRIGEGG
jgi:hypothetical protein